VQASVNTLLGAVVRALSRVASLLPGHFESHSFFIARVACGEGGVSC
jgi:hypothetical protein